jgi:AcrR family transcriptional regulator
VESVTTTTPDTATASSTSYPPPSTGGCSTSGDGRSDGGGVERPHGRPGEHDPPLPEARAAAAADRGRPAPIPVRGRARPRAAPDPPAARTARALARSQASADPTEAALIDVAVAEFAARPFDQVTVGDLCAAAGVGKGTFYRYFDSKEAAFFAAARAAAQRIATAVTASGPDDAARDVLPPVLAPVLPLLLELATRASRGSEPFLDAAREVFTTVVAVLEARWGGHGMTLLAEVSTELAVVTFGRGD